MKRTLTVAVFATFLATVGGCSSSAEAVPNGQAECERFVSGTCARLVACGQASTISACAADEGIDCTSAKFASKDVDAELTNQCLAAFGSLSCSAFQTPFTLPDACTTWAAQYR
jgi:hypothetical protein